MAFLHAIFKIDVRLCLEEDSYAPSEKPKVQQSSALLHMCKLLSIDPTQLLQLRS